MASGPWDNVQLAGPPNGPAWVNAAAQMMGATGNAVGGAFDAYRQAQDFKYQQQQRNLFQSPQGQAAVDQAFPSNQLGAPLARMVLQSGGSPALPQATQLMPVLQRQQLIDQYLRENGGDNQQPVSTGPATNSSASSPENIHGNFSQPRIPVSQPNNFQTGSDEGADTVRSLVAGLAGGKPVSTATINNYARSLGVSPDADLTEDQAEKAQRIISNSLAKQGIGTPTPNRGGSNRVAQSGTGEQESAGNELNPSGIGASSPMSPRQTSGQGNTRSATAPPGAITNDGLEDRRNVNTVRTAQAQQPAQGNPPLGAAAMVPPQFRNNPQAFAEYLRREADDLRRRNRLGELIGITSKTAEDRAKAYDDRAGQIEKQIGEEVKRTTEQQNLASGATEASKAAEAKGGAVGERVSEAIKAGGLAARHTINTIDTMQDAFRRSAGKLSEGPFAENTVKFKQAVNNVIPGFFDEGAVVDSVAITKLNAQLAAEAAKAMTARPSQLEFRAFMQNNPGLSTGVDGGLFLSEVIKRAKQQDIKLSAIAAKTSPDQWPDVEQKFFNDPKNSLFTKAERQNPWLVIGQKGPTPQQQPGTTQPGGWREIAPGIRIREKQPDANLRS